MLLFLFTVLTINGHSYNNISCLKLINTRMILTTSNPQNETTTSSHFCVNTLNFSCVLFVVWSISEKQAWAYTLHK